MEQKHEDNAYFGLQNTHLMENSQFNNQQVEDDVSFDNVGDRNEEILAGGGLGDIGAVVDSACKYEEHIEHGEGADEEWKYIKEKNQSEKQQNQHDFLKRLSNSNDPSFNADFQMEKFGELNGSTAATNGGGSNGANNHADLLMERDNEVNKNENDFSNTSNTSTSTTHTPTEEKDINADVMQVEMKIETVQMDIPLENQREYFDEEEPSSLATNGTSSLSENPPQQQEQLSADTELLTTPERPADLDFEMHSQLNPDAKEFVPHFGSNPSSPTDAVPVIGEQNYDSQPIANVARHVLGVEDDFVAQSPQKERCADMECIQVPAENEFENEISQRPHELAREDLFLGETSTVVRNTENLFGETEIVKEHHDLNTLSPVSLIDHGPETSVDLDNEILVGMKAVEDVMSQSIYVESTHSQVDEPIENLLNTVQPLPTVFGEDQDFNNQMDAEKELLHVDEKEQVSQSTSNDDMFMNLQNILHNADINEAFAEAPLTAPHTQDFEPTDSAPVLEREFLHVDDSELMDTTNPFDNKNEASAEESFEVVRGYQDTILDDVTQQQEEIMREIQTEHSNTSQSPLSTEEKHLVEDTKESPQLFTHDDDIIASTLEQKLQDMQLSHDDGNLTQMEPVAEIANAISETANPFFTTEPEPEEHFKIEHEVEPQKADFKINEQITVNEQFSAQHQEFLEQEQPHQEDAHEITDVFGKQVDESKEAIEQIVEPFTSCAEPIAIGEPNESVLEPVKDDVIAVNAASDVTAHVEATTAAAGIAAVAAVAVGAVKKTGITAKKPAPKSSTLVAKPRASGDVKKPIDTKKSTVATSSKAVANPSTTAPRPRAGLAKTACNAVTEKKSTGSITSNPTTAPAAGRKNFIARPAPKTTAVAAAPRASSAHAAMKTSSNSATASKAATSTTRSVTSATTVMRKTVGNVGNTATTTTSARSRATGGSISPTKPTSLGVNAATKGISPRAALRKVSAPSTAKSPTKPIANSDLTAKPSVTSIASRAKSTGAASVTTSTTTTTKRFVARPAPKSNTATSNTTTTTRRTTTSCVTNGSKSNGASTTAAKRLASPTKSSTAAKISPRNVAAKSPRTKDAASLAAGKQANNATKTAVELKKEVVIVPESETDTKANGLIDEPELNGNSTENGHPEEDHIQPSETVPNPAAEAALTDA